MAHRRIGPLDSQFDPLHQFLKPDALGKAVVHLKLHRLGDTCHSMSKP